MYIGIVAGEASGDALGAGLIRAIKKREPGVKFVGICGPKMCAEGANTIFPMESISIMGFDGLFQSVFKIIRIRKQLVRHFVEDPPKLFVGIDVPDFNLGLELQLRRASIKTVHYVSPTVWAWRGYRIRKIRRAVSHMLTLFPFEADYYKKQNVPVTFVGHPIADQIPFAADGAAHRKKLGLPADGQIIALLAGSRVSEVGHLGEVFIKTANELFKKNSQRLFIAPFANEATKDLFKKILDQHAPNLPVKLVVGKSREAMAASDAVLLASGTAALEAALLRKPIVVSYKVSAVTALLVRLSRQVKYFSMPNNLLGRAIIPEYLQSQATVDNLVSAMEKFLSGARNIDDLKKSFAKIHHDLRRNANDIAAQTVLSLINSDGPVHP